ncbi:hypothetical protein [Haloferax volcanii]|uniref:Secreted glycoprotein n=1 Tax=Haloferax volcanii TaxID=2246 RepID=A0A558G7I0_HALVO|nr:MULTISPECIES: hypothetical protein [Haloferax]NLV03651.1 hypothetical protein [Haloferax alexandrinus]TVT93721.1 hypothetical protein FQA18_15790 [Haloferax volcanii]
MDSKHVGWAAAVLLVLSFTAGVSAAAEPPTTTGDAAIDVPDTHRQVGQNNSTGLSEPNLTVVIDNRTVADGDTITTDDNPTLTVRANGSAPIDLLVVRVDGDSRRIYTPNSTAVNETATLDVNAGEHALEVLVQSNGRTTAHRATIIEDSIAPAIVFSSPFRTGNTSIYDRPENNYTINRSQIQLDGTLHDHSDVEQVTIELRYHGQGIDAPWGFRKRIVIDDPNTSISKSLRLGPFNEQVGAGQNSLKITALDSRGHRRHYNVNLYVEDEDPPSIEILDQRLINTRSAVRLTIRVTDQVGIRSVGVRRGSADGSGLNYEIQPKPVGARPIEHTFTKTIPLAGDSRNITIVADDGTENATKREIEVDHTQLVRPTIEVRPDTLRVSDNRVHVEGRVYDGRVTSVYAETVGPTGNTVDLAQIYGGGVTSAVTINETLQLDSYPARVRIRATDSTGREHIESVQVAQPNTTADPETASTTTPDSTVRTNTPLPGVPSESSSQGLLGTLVEAVRNLVSTTATGESLEV